MIASFMVLKIMKSFLQKNFKKVLTPYKIHGNIKITNQTEKELRKMKKKIANQITIIVARNNKEYRQDIYFIKANKTINYK